jgi:hypothetical protein
MKRDGQPESLGYTQTDRTTSQVSVQIDDVFDKLAEISCLVRHRAERGDERGI